MSSWYRSLYWRIAIGFVVGLAAMLVVQAVLFVWIVPGSGPSVPARPERFAPTVATDISEALEQNPSLDLEHFVGSQFGRSALPFIVMMNDGRIVDRSGGGRLSASLIETARMILNRAPPPFDRPDRGPGRDANPGTGRGGGSGSDSGPGGNPGSGRGRRGGRGFGPGFGPGRLDVTPIFLHDEPTGVVVVSPTAPFGFLLRRFAPTLALIGGSVLVFGGILAAVVIFGPARRRLRQVEDAARRLGGGDLTARAPARGGDEVAAVATAFNAMADDLKARADALNAADRTRRQLLADISHELTTPVTAIRGYLETLSMPDWSIDDATRTRYLSVIGDETARLERIIGDLLDLAKLEGGGGSIVIGQVAVDQVFARVADRHERAAAEANVRIVTRIDPGAETLTGDRDRLEQVLQNLAANALRYAPAGSPVELHARRDGDAIVLTVSDEGPGISPEHLPYVFDRFYKAEESRTVRRTAGSQPSDGSGLGLSIVKAIVERLGGTVSVESRPGRTVFTLRFEQGSDG
ncbi:MAG TPA: HAMP domain-containing sensor histidine kinase [Vicinamibacterales bacterium]|jgi:two-component system sensor histidine kinase BaeS|nr:HAMP domain-containing sensor histidine kinase [Vicinamibacterales bacterium]